VDTRFAVTRDELMAARRELENIKNERNGSSELRTDF